MGRAGMQGLLSAC